MLLIVTDTIMLPTQNKDVHILIPGTCEYFTLYGKGILQIWWRLKSSWYEEIALVVLIVQPNHINL